MGLDGVVETNVTCACHDHLIQLSSWDDGTLFMTIWQPIQTKEYGRWYWVWQSLKGRWNGNNEVVFDREATDQLAEALLDHLRRVKETG